MAQVRNSQSLSLILRPTQPFFIIQRIEWRYLREHGGHEHQINGGGWLYARRIFFMEHRQRRRIQ